MGVFEQTLPRFSLRATALFAVVFAAWLQARHTLALGDINPNIALAILIAYAAFEKNVWYLASLILAAFLILFPALAPYREFIAFGAAAFAGAGLLAMLSGRFLIGTFLASIIFSSIIFYVILDPIFLVRSPQIIVLEVLLNCIWGTLGVAYFKFADFSLHYR
jgi:hypothetical protein